MRKIALIGLFAVSLFAIDWHYSYDEAAKLSADQGKPILAVLMRQSCPYCQKLQQNTLANSAISSIVDKHFIPLYIDVEKAPDEAKKAKLFSQGVPASFILKDGKKIELVGYQMEMVYMGFLQRGL